MIRLLRLLLLLVLLVVVLEYNFINSFQILLLRFQLINIKTTKIQTNYNYNNKCIVSIFNHHHHLYTTTSKDFVSSSSLSSLFLYRNINHEHNDTQLQQQQQLPITTTSTTTQKTTITAANTTTTTTIHDVVVNRTNEWSNYIINDTTTTDTSIKQSQDILNVDVVPKENSKNNTTISNYIIPSTSSLPLSVTSSLGDIMSMTYIQSPSSSSQQIPLSTITKETTTKSFITQSIEPKNESSYTSSLQEMYHISHPLDRMILTANGNVQRLLSSYYDTNVYVNILYCNMREQSQPHPAITTTIPQIWDRKVQLYIQPSKKQTDNTITNTNNNQNHTTTTSTSTIIVLCEATSIITIYDIQIQQLIMSNQIGIGQIFRYYNILPNFTLHTAGPINTPSTNTNIHTNNNNMNNKGGGNFWREYTLSSTQLSCFIREEFIDGLWDVI